jgi:hypothetical protein
MMAAAADSNVKIRDDARLKLGATIATGLAHLYYEHKHERKETF